MRSLTLKSCDDVVIVIVLLRVAHVHVLSRNRLNEISRGRGHVSPFLSFPQVSVQIPPQQKYPFDLAQMSYHFGSRLALACPARSCLVPSCNSAPSEEARRGEVYIPFSRFSHKKIKSLGPALTLM